jgi:hypothetical protein
MSIQTVTPILASNVLQSLNELVKDGQNGLVFENSHQLATHLQVWGTLKPNDLG